MKIAFRVACRVYTDWAGHFMMCASHGDEVLALENIRLKTAYVSQEPLLFRGSILDNILFGNSDATREDAIEAARMADAYGFISEMTDGFDTLLADDGKNLSGGQKQRLAIARALVKSAPVLLLDEITSALDKSTEAQILETLKGISKTKTILIVTHDSEIAELADEIVRI